MVLYEWLEKAAKAKGGAKAVIYRDTYLSWRGLLHRVDRRAQEFEAMGVRRGDIVGLMLGNVPDFVILSFSLNKLGAAPLPLDPTAGTRELEMIMSRLPLRGLITRPRSGDSPLPVPRIGEKGVNGKRRSAPETRKRLQGTLLSCSIYATSTPESSRRSDDDLLAAVTVTADSAGDPKPVERTARNLRAQARHVTEALKLDDSDTVLLTIPLFHSAGFEIGLVPCLANGATLCLEDELAPPRIIKLVREKKVTVLPGNQTMFAELARLPAARKLSHKPVRFLSLGGGLSGHALDNFYKRYGVRPISCFHTTETGTISLDAQGENGATVGKPLPGVEVRVLNAKTGKAATTGRPGILWTRSEAVSSLDFATASQSLTLANTVSIGEFDGEGWYRTGDLVAIDRSKRLTLKGREDDLVRIDGKRIALGEVEGCIEAFPRVSAAQARMVTDPLGGPMVTARVVLKDPEQMIAAEMIIDHCARNLAPYKVPRRIEFCHQLDSAS